MIWKGKNGPLLIAEIGGNHEGSFQYAKKLLNLSCLSNIDVIKYQIYQGNTLVNKNLSPKRYNHFKNFELTKKQHLYLADLCKERGFKYLSSVWNKEDLGWIEKKMEFFKIGSGDLTAYDQIYETCKYKKPILLSTGLSTLKEIKETLNFIKTTDKFYKNKKNIAVLQCTSSYPTKNEEVNLNTLKTLKKIGYEIGYSHHGKSPYPLELAYALGCNILEFHFTDTRKYKKFRDHKISLTPKMVYNLIKKIKLINTYLGSNKKKPTKEEINSGNIKSFRRGLYLNKNIKKNSIIKKEDLVTLRPAQSLSAKFFFKLINKKAKRNLNKLETINIKDFK